jgi:S-adenosyl-L-methionine hydrolase (adenosine-forming)
MAPLIALYTDFGLADPYVGQLHAVLAQRAPGVPVVDLFHHAPSFDIRAAAYLLPAYARELPVGSIIVGVVDPGVGGPRHALLVRADARWYVGPDNGLFELVARRARRLEVHRIDWQPDRLSASFHGRDLFAPAAAVLAREELPAASPARLTPLEPPWPDDLARICHLDHYGNAITGMRAASMPARSAIRIAGHTLAPARVFSEMPPGQALWYENANGLVEIAVNRGDAAGILGLAVGMSFEVLPTNGDAWHP